MSQDLVGLILGACFIACVAVVLTVFADIARPTPQGGSTAVRIVSYATRPATCVPARTVATSRTRGRHRR
jgi:hypothetical protein